MNQINRSTRFSQKQDIHPLVAALDETNEDQRRLRDLIRRFHSGRWPLVRHLGMRQIDGVLYEAVEWLRMAKPTFGVVTWQADGMGLSWSNCESSADANALMRRL